ncbi:hypothetical protein HMPREF1531_00511 [Propionibacterium sp. oral taxon 192 str. F0372]|nr:hypothetical protein HMPREF1531_00511 [Propionibacterium sp. oral taxon 192 str. F0372]
MSNFSHAAQVPSGSFTPVNGTVVQIFDGQNLKNVLDALVARFSTALTNDRAEVENAKAVADGPLCSDGYDADATAANFLKAEQGMCRNLDSLVGSTAMAGMSAGFPEGFSPSGGTGSAGKWIETADASVKNQSPYDGWHKAMTDLHKIVEDSQTTKTESWQGDAGDAYRQDANDRTTEAISLESLARNSRDALDALVSVQATVVDALIKEFDGQIGMTGIADEAPTSQSDFENFGDSRWDDFHFYKRTCSVDSVVRGLIDFTNRLEGEGQKWVQASTQIGTTLQEAVNSARQNQTNDGSYSGDTEVNNSGGQCYAPGDVRGKNSIF